MVVPSCAYTHAPLILNSGQVYAMCSGVLRTMSATTSSSRRRVKRGGAFTYTVKLQNSTSIMGIKKMKHGKLDLSNLALRVVLPPGTRYVYTRNAVTPKPGHGVGIVAPELMDNIATWPLSALRGKSAWTLKMKIVTAKNTTAPSQLTVSATLVQLAGAALPEGVCPRALNDVTVSVV